MHALLPIALNTFREARRNRIFYSILFFAVGLILFSVLFTEVTFVAHDRILRDIGFATLNVFGVGIAAMLGIGMVNREIEKRTIYTVVTTVGLMFAGFLLALLLYRSPVEPALLAPLYALILELSVVAAFAILCSTWTTSIMSGFLTLAFFVIGHLVGDIRFFGNRSDDATVRALSRGLYFALPDLERFNLKATIAHLDPVSASSLASMTLYAVLWAGVFLVAAIILFGRRDFR